MLFNSIEFALFLPVVFILYWFVFSKNLRNQNALILIVSYIFYGWWDWRFLSLIVFSSMVDFIIGLLLTRNCYSSFQRKGLFLTSILVNIGFLGFFKYYNFFAESFVNSFTYFGFSFNLKQLNVILPVGISFYTFQTLSYSVDVYKRKMKGISDPVAFFAFVSFFPQLVAGPIERATTLLPQFKNQRVFSSEAASDGMRQILWGLFKKVVIADNCARLVNQIFADYTSFNGSTLVIGAILFSFQIYGDFSGYSDIAIGTARLFGFNLMRNFAFPYFSRDIAEFWRRWHISLSTWFRDYVYIPLGGSRVSKAKGIRNIFIIFIISGFWHGANWTFIIWGIIHAVLFLPLLLGKKNRKNISIVAVNTFMPSMREFLGILFTFSMVTLAWVFFRAPDVSDAISYLKGIFTTSLVEIPQIMPFKVGLLILVMLALEYINRNNNHGLDFSFPISKKFRWAIYYAFVIALFIFSGEPQEFIYFQF